MKLTANTTDKPKIVAIDDSLMVINFLKAFLSEAYEVTTYTSTSDALKDLSQGSVSPDCILTDFYLREDISGLEFIRQLKEIDPIIPVLVLSGSCDMNQKIECLRNGATDFVSKPFNPMELDARIKNVLSVSPQSNQYRYAV